LLRYYLKQPTDASDINALLPIADRMGIKPRKVEFLPESFVRTSEMRVGKYVQAVPASAGQWKALGYDVVVKVPRPVIVPAAQSKPKTRKPIVTAVPW
jgi:hypothetical protein